MLQPEIKGKFIDELYYPGNDLGISCQDGKTKFKLWSPSADKVELMLYIDENNDHCQEIIPLKQSNFGCWEVIVSKNLAGSYYLYKLYFGDTCRMTVDPYAKAVGTNSRKGLIVDLAQTNPDGWEEDKRIKLDNPVDAVIYELH